MSVALWMVSKCIIKEEVKTYVKLKRRALDLKKLGRSLVEAESFIFMVKRSATRHVNYPYSSGTNDVQ